MASITVMAHPRRAEWATEIGRALQARIVWDEKNDRWDTGRRALLDYDPAEKWHCVVQDDVVLSQDLRRVIDELVLHTGGDPISLYTGRRRPHQSVTRTLFFASVDLGWSWWVGKGPWWGPAVVLPTADIESIVEFGDARPDIGNYDLRISRWYESQGRACWYTVPCLVEHRDTDENPSLVEGRVGHGRVAQQFIGVEESGLSVDWSRVPEHIQDIAAQPEYFRSKPGRGRVRCVHGQPLRSRCAACPGRVARPR